jgi:hypothetical protein
MARIIISIACFVLAVAISGCQERASSDSAVEIEHSSIEAPQVNGKKNVVDTAKTQDKNNPIVIAYYFHRTVRCPTCLAIEANAARVIEENFPQQIAEGVLTWIPFNLDDPGGEEFENEFDVSVSTLVLSKTEESIHTKYIKLEKVWDLIGDPVKFDTYIQNKVRRFMNE